MENIKQRAREIFDNRFIPNHVKIHSEQIDVDKLGIPMIPQEVKTFIDQIIDLTIAERDREIAKAVEAERERILNVIERLKIDERTTREYMKNDECWVVESYTDKQFVNTVYSHLKSVIEDLPVTKTNKTP